MKFNELRAQRSRELQAYIATASPRVAHLFDNLPPSEMTALALTFLGEFPVNEAADILGVSPHALRQRTHSAIARLRRAA